MTQNRLARESSPYLQSHSENPVDWWPWGKEAMETAKREDKPILLSIGYAACHWCHVMAHESFENPDIAARMNELFVNIKVDREERPDIDHVYQLVVQVMGRNGGWPLTVFLTPDGQPYFAGTYFPPVDRMGMPGFSRLIEALADAYTGHKSDVLQQAKEFTMAVTRAALGARRDDDEEPAAALGPDLLARASEKLLGRFDGKNGGFHVRPKFPNTMALEVLLRRGALEGDEKCRFSVELALDRMRSGGIWDHLRGGFHRYSTDERWLVPHFEKMLYDNALLLRLYTDASVYFGKQIYATTARELVGYLLSDMRDTSGAFYASQDADSEGEEGKFFVWTLEELKQALSDDLSAFEVARLFYGVTAQGNFEHTGACVLHASMPFWNVAPKLDIDQDFARRALHRARTAMLDYREQREWPARDDKVLASWNGLLISALAHSGRVLSLPAWVDAAAKAFAAIESALVRDGRVGRYFMPDKPPSAGPGFLDDQAYFGNAALDLYNATGEPHYAEIARAIATQMVAHHADKDDGGFFFTPDDGDALIVRTKDHFDQAIPSASAMAALLCMRVGALADPVLTAAAEAHLKTMVEPALATPLGMSQAVLVLHRLVRGSVDVVIVGPRRGAATVALADACFSGYAPDLEVAYLDPSDPASRAAIAVLAEGKEAPASGSVAYVCRDRTCSAPVSTPAELIELLGFSKAPAVDPAPRGPMPRASQT